MSKKVNGNTKCRGCGIRASRDRSVGPDDRFVGTPILCWDCGEDRRRWQWETSPDTAELTIAPVDPHDAPEFDAFELMLQSVNS